MTTVTLRADAAVHPTAAPGPLDVQPWQWTLPPDVPQQPEPESKETK